MQTVLPGRPSAECVEKLVLVGDSEVKSGAVTVAYPTSRITVQSFENGRSFLKGFHATASAVLSAVF
jgi:hypothetical protein